MFLMALDGQPVSALLPSGFQDQSSFFGLHPTTESVFAFSDDLGWCLQMIFHSPEIITHAAMKSRFLYSPPGRARIFSGP